MLNKIRDLLSLVRSLGLQWLLFRISYTLRKRTGYMRIQMPQYGWKDHPLETWLKKDVPSTPQSYFDWRQKNKPRFFFENATPPESVSWNPLTAVREADRILSGELKYFSHAWHQTGFPPDWHRDPVTGAKVNAKKHWSQLSDHDDVDIKFIWEPSRFATVYSLVRAYGSARDEKYAEAFWKLIQSWAESNPPNTGPNWMDGQEAALRVMAWMFGYYQFSHSPATTPDRNAQFTMMVAAHAERIYNNIDYAISTRSNHTISEAFGLWLVGLLFPELKNSQKYFDLGHKLLEQEAAAQIFPDGGYSMYSLNYHRFILQIYLAAIRLAEINNLQFSSSLHTSISASLHYLSHLIDPTTGTMPVYGSNDGALVLPLNNCDFTDYRPLLQLGSHIMEKAALFEPGPWNEDVFWLCGEKSPSFVSFSPKHSVFPHAGTHLLHGSHSRAILRCTDHRSRPSHADQLHLDLWMHGHNIAIDAGTYLYSGEGSWRNGLAHTAVHNTVTVDGLDQMKMLTRFTWTDWSHGRALRRDENLWRGEHDSYRRLPDPVNHRRTVILLGDDRWLVVDYLTATQQHHYDLHWLLCDGDHEVLKLPHGNALWLNPLGSELLDGEIHIQMGVLHGNADFSVVRADPNSTRGWRSRYYGEKEAAISMLLEVDQPHAIFWTFFGSEGDVVDVNGEVLQINSQEINLTEINK